MKKLLKGLLVGGLATLVLAYGYGRHTKWKELENIVIASSEKNQVVMFGETHKTYRKDNDFVIGILPELKKQGFEYLALELKRNPVGVTELDYQCKKVIKDYVIGKIEREDIPKDLINPINQGASGWLDLIEAAKEMNMKIVCYDANLRESKSSWNHREEIAFNNIKELIFDKDPDAKVIVYCGGRHIHEKQTSDPRIREITGENVEFKCLGVYLDEYTKGKNCTVYFYNYYDYSFESPNCDIVLNLDDLEYEYRQQSKLKAPNPFSDQRFSN